MLTKGTALNQVDYFIKKFQFWNDNVTDSIALYIQHRRKRVWNENIIRRCNELIANHIPF